MVYPELPGGILVRHSNSILLNMLFSGRTPIKSQVNIKIADEFVSVIHDVAWLQDAMSGRD
jgi:hypothetical protein